MGATERHTWVMRLFIWVVENVTQKKEINDRRRGLVSSGSEQAVCLFKFH